MQAFGVGAFEEEDEDIYGREDIASKYNFYLDDDPDGYGQLHTILLPIFEVNHSLTLINELNWIVDPTWTLTVATMDEAIRRNLVGAARRSPHRPALRASPKLNTSQLSSRPFHSLSCQKISDLCAMSNRQGLSLSWLTKSDPWQTPSRNLRKRSGETQSLEKGRDRLQNF